MYVQINACGLGSIIRGLLVYFTMPHKEVFPLIFIPDVTSPHLLENFVVNPMAYLAKRHIVVVFIIG